MDICQLTIIPRGRVGYEMVDSSLAMYHLISNKREWNNFFYLKRPKMPRILPDFVKTTDFQLVFNFEQTRPVTIFGEHGIMAHIHDG